jgi:hypothetical protein
VRKIGPLFFLLYSLSSFSQIGENIILEEVVNVAASVPKIEIDNLTYSMKDRDKVITRLLRSKFWTKSFKFVINLEDFDTGRQYSYENEGGVKIFINDEELTERHLFKTYKTIKNVLDNSERIQIISKIESQIKIKVLTAENNSGQIIYKSNTEEKPVTIIYIKSNLPLTTRYNGSSKSRKIKTLADFELISQEEKLSMRGNTVLNESTKNIKLDNVEVVQDIKENGIVYSPKLINGKIVFKKNNNLTKLYKKRELYKKQGLNEWGIDVDANTWAVALRKHLRGKQTGITSDGLPLLFGAITLGDTQPGPLWVIDGVRMGRPPMSIRSLATQIREVNVLKFAKASKYGSQGAGGVIEVNTVLSSKNIVSYDRSFEVKGKRNIELMKEFNVYEERFMSERDKLEDKRKILIELNEFERIDSIQKLLDLLILKSYLFTANFAINNSEQEIAPYLAIKKIPDARIEILESIEKELSDEVKKTHYGKSFQKLLNQRRSSE